MSDEIFSNFHVDVPPPPHTPLDVEPRQKRKRSAKQRKAAPRIGQAPVKRKAAPVKAKGPGRPKGSRNKPKNRPTTDRQSPGRPPKIGFVDGLLIGANLEPDDLKLFGDIHTALQKVNSKQQHRILDALCRATR